MRQTKAKSFSGARAMILSTETQMAERRSFPRTQVRMPVQVTRMDPDGGDVVEQVEMVDISRGGMGALAGRWHYPGQRMVVRLPGAGMGVRNICGIVLRCTPHEGMFHVGIEFERPMASLCAEEPRNAGMAA
jgi:hypothetical protein